MQIQAFLQPGLDNKDKFVDMIIPSVLKGAQMELNPKPDHQCKASHGYVMFKMHDKKDFV